MRPHRYVFGLGYGSGAIMSSGLVVINMMLEIVGEAIIDVLAAYTELKQGIPLNEYFFHWKTHTLNLSWLYMNIHALAMLIQLFIFRVVPTAIFCKTPDDVCSCTGGGFDIYDAFCTSASVGNATNGTTDSIKKLPYNASEVRASYVNPFEFMGDNLMTIVFGAVVLICVLAIMMVAMYILHIRDQAATERTAHQQLEMKAGANKR